VGGWWVEDEDEDEDEDEHEHEHEHEHEDEDEHVVRTRRLDAVLAVLKMYCKNACGI